MDQFKIPREYFKLDDDEKINDKEIYRPTGPDGKGWGEYRELKEEDILLYEEMRREDERRALRKNKTLDESGYVGNGDKMVIYY